MAQPFRFHSSIKLPEFTGRRASTVAELLEGIQAVDGSSIFHHTFHFVFEHQYATAQPPSGFAYWVGTILLDHGLAERLTAVNPVEFPSLRSLRERLINVIEDHRGSHDCSTHSPDGMDFFFMRANTIVVPTLFSATDLASFGESIERVPISSIFHHMFEARLRLEGPSNDLSAWIGQELGHRPLAERIARLDPYLLTLEGIRRRILVLVRSALEEKP